MVSYKFKIYLQLILYLFVNYGNIFCENKLNEEICMAEKKQNIESFEQSLWKAADKLRKNIDAAEYKHVVLGLIFLRYISEAFEDLYEKLKKGEGEYSGADPEDKDEYLAENVFYIPPEARWSHLKAQAKDPEIGKVIDRAMELIEKENSSLKGVLPKVYARGNIDPINLGGLIDLFSNIAINEAKEKTSDILGHVFEYFLGEFALAEGKKGGQFYTPRSVVELLVEMLEPYRGRVFDPCCGSGGMFVQSEKFVKEHQGKINDISIYGQESNQTTWRLCKMNLAIRGIDSTQVKWNPEGSFLNDAHKDLKADFVIANPPFNDSDWSGELLRADVRWKYGIPTPGNANYAWIQHFAFHITPHGKAGFVLAKGALTTKQTAEYEIRKNMIEDDIIDCIVNLPAKLFLNTQIPACLWFIRKNKTTRKGQILFIDTRDMGQLINRRNRVLTPEEIRKIADTYQRWQNTDVETPKLGVSTEMTSAKQYQDIAGFCKSATTEEVRELDYVLTPGRYVGLPDEEDDFDFEEIFTKLKAEFLEQLKEEERVNKLILENLEKIEMRKDEV
ncbi:MAG: Site-specific DNA-methyltransferase (adenine-specific) [Deferribacteraceae bacterium]|jgi:type I restriction enzyme M protein|nr:Site-specific DNA-methyltransferase (adenine-specific) [Deferribacteraceae bacterium]